MQRLVPVILGAVLVLSRLGTQASDLVVWRDKGSYAQEEAAVRDTIAAFEQKTGSQVELAFHEQMELPSKIAAALEAGQPPDFAWGFWLSDDVGQWALEELR